MTQDVYLGRRAVDVQATHALQAALGIRCRTVQRDEKGPGMLTGGDDGYLAAVQTRWQTGGHPCVSQRRCPADLQVVAIRDLNPTR